MFCQRCGTNNSDYDQYCKNCGSPLTNIPNINNNLQSNRQSKNNTGLIIICITIILVVLIAAGTFLYLSNDTSSTPSINSSPAQPQTASGVSSGVSSQESSQNTVSSNAPLEIISGSFYTGSSLSSKTQCKVFVGQEHAGEKVKISVLYSRDGSNLNQGKIVPVTVDGSGYVSVSSADAFKYYPDNAYITLYDSAGDIQDTRNVYMNAAGGTQTF